MIEAAGGRFPPGTAAHDKGPHCRLTVDAVVEPFDPAVKPAPTQIEEIFCQIAVDRGGRAEIDIARISERAVAMRPRAEDQLCRLALWTREALVIFHRGAGIGVVPARQVHCRYTRIALVKPFGVDAGLPPEFVKRAARPLLEQVILVFRRGTDRGVASAPTAPRQPVEPGGDVLRGERGPALGIAGIGQRVAPRPSRLFQIERAAMPVPLR